MNYCIVYLIMTCIKFFLQQQPQLRRKEAEREKNENGFFSIMRFQKITMSTIQAPFMQYDICLSGLREISDLKTGDRHTTECRCKPMHMLRNKNEKNKNRRIHKNKSSESMQITEKYTHTINGCVRKTTCRCKKPQS